MSVNIIQYFIEINKSRCKINFASTSGGEGGIRTHGPRKRTTVFKTVAFDHSATSPKYVNCNSLGGEGGIRTLEPLSRLTP